ncbi:hypothetical protein [Vogesella sp. LIG4]|uniref:hypothetical protein n=1 Tax=Vogesella sp. LIG4 TaxID=1192162 RepID=UPI0012FD5181|nr:hypothetical protein [Vogesella sp. LIG4]
MLEIQHGGAFPGLRCLAVAGDQQQASRENPGIDFYPRTASIRWSDAGPARGGGG